MRILEINTEKTWRGGERQTFYTVKGLKDSGIYVELLCLRDYPLFKKSKSLNISLHGVDGQLGAIKFLVRYGSNFDIIHAQTAKGQSIAVFLKPFHKRPVVYTRRVDFIPSGSLTKFKYRMTDKVIAISTAIRDILEGFGISNVEVIPSVAVCGRLDRKRAETIKDQLDIRDKKVIATIAALVPHKDPMTMVASVKELLSLRSDFVFLHFGGGPLKEDIAEKIREFGLEDVYKLMGYHDNVEDFFSSFDIFVMSSAEEGLGSTVLDAFLYKVPVISTAAGGLKETVAGRGLICPVKDHKCLAGSIDRMLKDDDLRKNLTDKAYDDVLKNYSLDRNIEQYIKIFRKLT